MRRRSACFLFLAGFCAVSMTAEAQFTLTNIAYAKRDAAPQNFYADGTGEYWEVRGRVTSPSFMTNRTMFFLQDTNDNVGIHVYAAFVKEMPLYTEAKVSGFIAQSNGLRMIVGEFNSDLEVINPATVVVSAVSGTISDLLADAERYEGTFVVISNVYRVGSTWPAWQATTTLTVTDLTGQISVRIHSSTDIDGQLAPTNAFDLYGIFSQYDTSATPNSGYQVWPRFYTDIIQSEGQEPPELFVVNSNTFSIAVGEPLSVQLIAQDRNPEDVLVVATNDAPAGSAVANFANREASFTWTPDAGYVGTTNKIILEVTDGVSTSTVGLDVFVLSDELSNIRLNEVHWDPAPGIAGDANGDGVRDGGNLQDEFVEIVNNNATEMDLSGWVLRLGTNELFTFPATVLTGKAAVVVFGGGTPTGLFGHSIVYAASPTWGGLANDPGGRAVSLWTAGGAQIFSYDYSLFGTPDVSATRNPDFTGDYTLHTSVVSVLRWSPGVMASGKYYEGTGQTNSAPIIPPLENRAVGVGKSILISFSAIDPEANPIIFSVSNAPATATFTDNGNGTATLAYTGVVEDLETIFAITLYAGDAIDDSVSKTFNLTVLSGQYAGLVINEFLANPGSVYDSNGDGATDNTQDEFLEIVNNSTGEVDVTGMMIYDAAGLKHRFTSDVIPAGGAIVVFGGGNISAFPYRPVQKSSSGMLGFANVVPETIILYSPQTNEIDRYDYVEAPPAGASLTRYPDITGVWTNHLLVTTNALRGSPGRRVHGQPFLTNQPPFFNPVANKSVALSNSLTFGVSALETDGDLVTLTASNLPAGAEFFPTNANGAAAGTFLWTNAEPAGVYTSEFYAVDEDGAVSTSVVITVTGGGGGGEYSGAIWINEIHYDNAGADANEGVEIAGPAGTDLANYTLYLYNGNGGVTYSPTTTLSGVIGDEGCGYGALWFAIVGLQNGASDAVALVYNSDTSVIQFLSYEGAVTAANGPAVGMTSIDIGVSEAGSEAVGLSLQLQGSGTNYAQFAWAGPTNTASAGLLNVGQTISPCGGGEPDTDSDGIPDWWEELYYGGPTNATPTDLASNAVNTVLEAFIADIDPLDPGAFFEIEDISGAALRSVTFLSSTGRLYTFQYSDNLINADGWSNLVTDAAGTNSTTTLSDTNPPAGNRSYRVRVRVP